MIKSAGNKIRGIISPQNSRNRILRNNILFSTIIKVVGLLISLLIVPATLDYLDKEQYGIWMTISSILLWFSYFDVGLGNGMRNYLAQSISLGDYEKGRIYISTTFAMIAIIAFILILLSIPLLAFLDFNKVFNTTAVNGQMLTLSLLVAIIFTLILFVVKNVGMVYVAMQKYAINDLLIVSSNAIALLFVYIITKNTDTNLLYIVLTFTATPVVVFIIASVSLFNRHPELRPSIKHIDKDFGKRILTKGFGFFFIQITSCLVIFGGANVFIAQAAGPESVTVYNIAYKFFNLLVIAYTIVVAPMWNAYTDAYVKQDYAWIRNTLYRALCIWGLTLIAGAIMLMVSNFFYRLWIGNSVMVPFSVSFCVYVYITFFNLNNCVTALINGVNKIQVQIITSIIFTALYIVTVTTWGTGWGIEGIVLCMAISYAAMSLIHLYQSKLIIQQKASGIWNK